MGKFSIRKRISLDFIGKEYEEGYFIFRAIPLSEYDQIMTDMDKIKDDNKKSIPFILELLKSHFIEGKFPDDKGVLLPVEADDIGDIDVGTCLEIFQRMTGTVDPKFAGQLPAI